MKEFKEQPIQILCTCLDCLRSNSYIKYKTRDSFRRKIRDNIPSGTAKLSKKLKNYKSICLEEFILKREWYIPKNWLCKLCLTYTHAFIIIIIHKLCFAYTHAFIMIIFRKLCLTYTHAFIMIIFLSLNVCLFRVN